jgi:hypothetical protein
VNSGMAAYVLGGDGLGLANGGGKEGMVAKR